MIGVIAGATCREAVRSKTFVLLLVIFAVAVLLSRVVGWISGTDGHIITANVVMSLQSIIGVLVAVATGTVLVHSEVQQRTLYTVLTRPMSRWQFIVGKFLGLCAALMLGQLAMMLIGMAYLWITGAEVHAVMWLAGLLTIGEVLVMAAIALMWTAVSSPLLAAVLGLATYALGHAVHTLPHYMHFLDGWKQIFAITAASLIPNLGYFTFRDRAVYGEPTIQQDWLALPYGALWMLLLLTITVAVFRKKQL